MIPNASSERRVGPRTRVGATFDAKVRETRRLNADVTVWDISPRGMSLCSDAELPEGSTLILSSAGLLITGEVRSARKLGGDLKRYGVVLHKVTLAS